MANDIIYVCNCVNNRNVREGELEILRKFDDQKYFEFGENEMNIKKRYYKDLDTLNKDFNALMELKNKEIKEESVKPEEPKKMVIEDEIIGESAEAVKEEPKKEKGVKKNYKKFGKKSNLF